VGDFYSFDAELSYRRAEVFGKVVASLTAEQKAEFAKMKFGDFNTWPDLDERDALQRPNPTTSRFFPVAYMTYASEFFSWHAGSVEADTYFCPERHGTYFGSFYMKDMPAMNKRDYDISTAVTGDSGENFLNLLNADQRANITVIPDRQKKLLAETVEVRQAMSVELRMFLSGGQADKARVLALGRRYGALDGEMSWIYATAFAKVGRTLTPEQHAACVKLRNLDGYHSAPAYLYSNPLQELPALPNSDFLFSAPAQNGAAQPSASASPTPSERTFTLRSSATINGGRLPVEYTGDGAGVTPPLEWNSPPSGTKAYAVIMHHIDPEGITKWYWTLYNIPADVQSLPRNVRGIGIVGNNSINGRTEYAPPHSKGPGDKTYILTVYALSSPLDISAPADQVTRDVLLASMKNKILASSELQVVYAREGADPEPGSGRGSRASAQEMQLNAAARGGLGNRGATN
jgi:Raf kinase inhibitor-like YbhB/YbcL family protein